MPISGMLHPFQLHAATCFGNELIMIKQKKPKPKANRPREHGQQVIDQKKESIFNLVNVRGRY